MTISLHAGLDFFSTVLESPLFMSDGASTVINVADDDLEKLDALGTGNFSTVMYLIIGDSSENSKEVIEATYSKAVLNGTAIRLLQVAPLFIVQKNHDAGSQVFCGNTFKYMNELSSGVTELEDAVTEGVSRVLKENIIVDVAEYGFSEYEEGEGDGISVLGVGDGVIPLLYVVPSNCGQLSFNLPSNEIGDNIECLLLDISNLRVSESIIVRVSTYSSGTNAHPHRIAIPVYDGYQEIPLPITYIALSNVLTGNNYPYISLTVTKEPGVDKSLVFTALIGGTHLLP